MSDFWNQRIIPTLTNPILALHGVLFLVINLGLIKVLTSVIWERKRDFGFDFELLANELAMIFFVAALVYGAVAITYGLLGHTRPAAASDEDMKARMLRWASDPFLMLTAGIYALAYAGLVANFVLMYELRGAGPVSLWSWWATQMFFTLAGVLALLAIRQIAVAVGGDAMGEAPASEDSGESGSDEKSAEAGSESGDSGDSDESDDSEDSKPAEPGFADRWYSKIPDPSRQLTLGIILLGYLGGLFLVLDISNLLDFRPNTIWRTFFWELGRILGAMGAVILLARLVAVASHTDSAPASEASSGALDGESSAEASDDVTMANQMAARFTDPGQASVMVLVLVAAAAGAWGLMNIWLSRNEGALDFWAEVTWTLHLIVPAIMLPIILWSMWQVITSPIARASKTLLYDPFRLTTIAIFLIAYLGVVDMVFHTWIYRDAPPAFIWDTVAEDLFNVVGRVAIFVALQAIMAALALGREPAEIAAE